MVKAVDVTIAVLLLIPLVALLAIPTYNMILALGFVFVIPATFAIQLQLFGGIPILQVLPAFIFGLITKNLNRRALFLGLLAGVVSEVYMMGAANSYTTWTTTLIGTGLGAVFIGMIALVINIIIVFAETWIANAMRVTNALPRNADVY